MSHLDFVFKGSDVRLNVYWGDCDRDSGSEDDTLRFEYSGTAAALCEVLGLPTGALEKRWSGHRPKGLKVKAHVDRDGDVVRVVSRSNSKVRLWVWKPLEHALQAKPFVGESSKTLGAASLLDRFIRGPAAQS